MTWAVFATVAALIPALLFLRNLRLFAPPPSPSTRPAVSVLIPARNEERSIRDSVAAALRSEGVELEVVVLDDHSEDRTAEIVVEMAGQDPRVRLETAPPLPAGWCGKQHACYALSRLARNPYMVFLDADVRLAPEGLGKSIAFLERSGAGLVSGFPRQETVTFLERLLLPLIHFVLLGFLPMKRMRSSLHPSYGAGCGQLFVTRREDYDRSGGHAAIPASLHDGISLPRAFRRAGIATDLFDATGVAVCRMYRNAEEVWSGLAKNATEGVASPGKILPITVLLIAGQVLPYLLLIPFGWAALPAVVAAWLPRLIAVRRFRQPLDGALLHPLGILAFLAVQWYALGRQLLGRPAGWKGRVYTRIWTNL
ncbi:MAG TPA: glycosyltransferase family 2 protein [Thermoanaerobaculia bacterium]|nr:glycosyltransferase family 2 protein [Thermoanaerobaculia bacterium]